MIIILQDCPKNCTCSFCHDFEGYVDAPDLKLRTKMHYGLNIPRAWRDGWWTVKYWPHRYIRIIWRLQWPWRWCFRRDTIQQVTQGSK